MENEKPWMKMGKWSVSEHNWADEVRKLMPNLPKKIEVRDVTFREADDQHGLYLKIEDKVKLALKVSEIGIRELDIGGPNLLPHQGEASKAIRKAYDKAGIDKSVTRISGRYFGLCKDQKHEIDVIMGVGCTDARICMMSPNITGVKGLDEQIEKMKEAVEYCHKKYNATITVGMDETSRTRMEYVVKAYKAIVEAGADKAWFSDTNGVAIPLTQRYLAMEIKKIIGDMPLACHIHNHAGMATAVTLAAIEGGTTEPDLTWNGYGDQAGNACLEEVVCDLEAMYGVQTGVNLEKLTEISKMVEEMCGWETQRGKAYTGKDAYAHGPSGWSTPTGMMLSGLSKEEIDKLVEERRKLMPERERFNPELIGQKHLYVWGAYGNRQPRLVKAKLASMGILNYTDQDVKKIQDALTEEVEKRTAINKELIAKKVVPYLVDEEYSQLIRSIIRT